MAKLTVPLSMLHLNCLILTRNAKGIFNSEIKPIVAETVGFRKRYAIIGMAGTICDSCTVKDKCDAYRNGILVSRAAKESMGHMFTF